MEPITTFHFLLKRKMPLFLVFYWNIKAKIHFLSLAFSMPEAFFLWEESIPPNWPSPTQPPLPRKNWEMESISTFLFAKFLKSVTILLILKNNLVILTLKDPGSFCIPQEKKMK